MDREPCVQEHMITGLLLIVAVIHLLPISGVAGADRLSALYGVALRDDNLVVLMQHRAVLFGILGGFFAYAAFEPTLQPLAFGAASVSIVSFFYLAYRAPELNDSLRRVVMADVVAALALLGAMALRISGG